MIDTDCDHYYARSMEVELTPDQQAFVEQVIASGRLQDEAMIMQEAFTLWERRERRRTELVAALSAAESDLDAGLFTDYSEASLSELASDLKVEAKAQRTSNLNK